MSAPRVLLIDDEAAIRLLCRVNLESDGMHVTEAVDGRSGIDKAREESPDAILLDSMLPDTDSWEVVEQLRADPSTRRIPIVVFTSRREFENRPAHLDVERVHRIPKPF